MTPSYRTRLRVEGLTLAAFGAAGSVVLLALVPESRRGPLSTVGQLAVVIALVAFFGRRGANRSMERSTELRPGQLGSGEPTPLWQLPLIVAALTAIAGIPAGWDAGLRVTVGCMLVGLGQAVLIERTVAAGERSSGRRYFRVKGSRILRGTKLGYLAAAAPP